MLSDERIWELIEQHTGITTKHRPTAIVSAIHAAIAEAVAEEQERCLRIVEGEIGCLMERISACGEVR